jgi:hypothetical protein
VHPLCFESPVLGLLSCACAISTEEIRTVTCDGSIRWRSSKSSAHTSKVLALGSSRGRCLMAARLRTKQLLLARTSLDRLHRMRARCAVHASFTQLHAVAV